MATEEDTGSKTTYDHRLTFRSYRRLLPKLELVAMARNFIERGKPNVSAAINYIIERFDPIEEEKILKAAEKEKKA